MKQNDAIRLIAEFLRYKEGWDSYDGKPINRVCAGSAIAMIEKLGDGWQPVPCADGSIQIERHADGLDIEISIEESEEVKRD